MADEGTRVDRFLADLPLSLSRTYIQKILKDGGVLVNGRTVRASFRLSAEDRVCLHIPEVREPCIEAENIPLDILYEDEDLLVVNKPQGMVVHPSAGHMSGTLVNALLYHCGDSLSGINGILRPGIVHRIDKDTSGALVVCKNDSSHRGLAEQFAVHSCRRRYRAVLSGVLPQDAITIDAPIGRDERDRKRMAVVPEGKGKRAVTHLSVLQRFSSFTYTECVLETGRTHQIRVHTASINTPVLGDPVYGRRKCPFSELKGQVLHAMTLGFIHPRTGEIMDFTAPLPNYFEKLLQKL
ncbi:MAG: RluA family pseudouridine synthase [Eubacterium sp.]|nr:RluA family pseudouridine synthase [Eubacterium sp.]